MVVPAATISEGLLSEFRRLQSLYQDFTDSVQVLIGQLLSENKIRLHSISARVKDESSLKNKLAVAEAKYSSLKQVTDLAGVRIITYFHDDVDAVAQVLEKEFEIDKENSVDKRMLIDPDRFGYMSLHYIVRLPPDRLKLTEYKRFTGCCVEIQVRSILQHTWAEIEHDLGYKANQAIPREVRRRFSRLAGLLEVADTEFAAIRDDLKKYEYRVTAQIEREPSRVLVDKVSVSAFVESSETVKSVNMALESFGMKFATPKDLGLGATAAGLRLAGFETIAEVEDGLRKYRDLIINMAKILALDSKETSSLFSLVMLCFAIFLDQGTMDKADEFIGFFQIAESSRRKEGLDVLQQAYVAATGKGKG